jgi:CRISPR type III-A-associated protein Csm2
METIGEKMGQRQCTSCKKWFRPKEDRHKTCYDCAMKAKKEGASSYSSTQGGRPGFRRAPENEEENSFALYLSQLREQGYFKDGNLRTELLVEDAQTVAWELVQAGVTTGQLRRFFTMARSLEQRLAASKDFRVIVPEIASLQPFAAAVVGRGQTEKQRAELETLREFIDTNATQARQSEQAFLKGFLPHFESVMAYFTLFKPKER